MCGEIYNIAKRIGGYLTKVDGVVEKKFFMVGKDDQQSIKGKSRGEFLKARSTILLWRIPICIGIQIKKDCEG